MANLGKMYCPNCGAEIDEKAEICPHCGVRIGKPRYNKSRIIAGMLGIFLGGIGAHKFYLGRIGLGIVYIVFCWTTIPAIVGFIEGIVYLSMTDEDFAEKYSLND